MKLNFRLDLLIVFWRLINGYSRAVGRQDDGCVVALGAHRERPMKEKERVQSREGAEGCEYESGPSGERSSTQRHRAVSRSTETPEVFRAIIFVLRTKVAL
ncbi:hypothetical protein X777_07012 [Ooceraea biroi]|uniref:Secreted protein n=1 Tax=Ooceraea biroi TaxID=2015173 RepID=A0A026WET3_OOCBI|nr:hypothetical protein X777_07012 [Ooceraea biroi]